MQLSCHIASEARARSLPGCYGQRKARRVRDITIARNHSLDVGQGRGNRPPDVSIRVRPKHPGARSLGATRSGETTPRLLKRGRSKMGV